MSGTPEKQWTHEELISLPPLSLARGSGAMWYPMDPRIDDILAKGVSTRSRLAMCRTVIHAVARLANDAKLAQQNFFSGAFITSKLAIANESAASDDTVQRVFDDHFMPLDVVRMFRWVPDQAKWTVYLVPFDQVRKSPPLRADAPPLGDAAQGGGSYTSNKGNNWKKKTSTRVRPALSRVEGEEEQMELGRMVLGKETLDQHGGLLRNCIREDPPRAQRALEDVQRRLAEGIKPTKTKWTMFKHCYDEFSSTPGRPRLKAIPSSRLLSPP